MREANDIGKYIVRIVDITCIYVFNNNVLFSLFSVKNILSWHRFQYLK